MSLLKKGFKINSGQIKGFTQLKGKGAPMTPKLSMSQIGSENK